MFFVRTKTRNRRFQIPLILTAPFYGALVWMVGLTVQIKRRFKISTA